MRIGVVIAGLVMAWGVVVLVGRRGTVGPGSGSQRGPAPRTELDQTDLILVILYSPFGAAIAVAGHAPRR